MKGEKLMQAAGEWHTFPVPDAFAWVCPAAAHSGVCERACILPCGGEAALLYLFEGAGLARWEGEEEAYAANSVLFAHAAHALRLTPASPTRYGLLLLRNAADYALAAGPHIQADACTAQSFSQLLEDIRGHANDAYQISSRTHALLMDILSLARPAPRGSLVRDALAILEHEYATLSGIDELSDRLGVSSHHLIRAFGAQTGDSPGRYLRRIRIQAAQLLLAYRDYSVEAIALMVGYSGGNYFCKAFRQETGFSPGAYRTKTHPDATPAALAQLRALEGGATL